MDPVLEIQAAILARLNATAGVTAIVGQKVYDSPPPGTKEPYITIGPSSYQTEDADCIYGGEVTIQVDGWSVANELSEIERIGGAIRAALRSWEPALTTNALVTFDHWRTDYTQEEDSTLNIEYRHVSVRYTATIEEP